MSELRMIAMAALSCVAVSLHAQDVRNAKGSISYVIPHNMTLEHAEVVAVEQAKLKIIADNFGTVVSSSTTLTMSDENGMSSLNSFTFGETEVRGEWLETISGPKVERTVINNEFVLNIEIAGKIREIVSSPIQFHSMVLRNGVTDNCSSDRFKERDKMYVSFQSPEEGYVSIYMTDGKAVQCLFPYSGLSSEHMKVDADRRYVFFSKNDSGNLDPMRVRECTLGCEADNEYNRIYMIFSPNKYAKAVDHYDSTPKMPRSLSFEEFHTWLSKLRQLDNQLTCKSFDIIINK